MQNIIAKMQLSYFGGNRESKEFENVQTILNEH